MSTFPMFDSGMTDFPSLNGLGGQSYENTFDYSKYTAPVTLRLLSVSWRSDYKDVVRFEDEAARDAWFSTRGAERIEHTTPWARVPERSVNVPLPYERCMDFNYLYLDIPQQPVNASDAPTRLFYFVTSIEYEAPSTTKLNLELDVWQTYGYRIEVSSMVLDRGHAPMYRTDLDEFLGNPKENSAYLLAKDVDFSDGSELASNVEHYPLGSGIKWLVMALPIAPDDLAGIGEASGASSGAPTYSDAAARNGYQLQVNGYGWAYEGQSFANLSLDPTPGLSSGGRVPDGVCLYGIPYTEANAALVSLAAKAPHVLAAARYFAVVPIELAQPAEASATTHMIAGHAWTHIKAHPIVDIDPFELSRDAFDLPGECREIAKCYVYPYTWLVMSDNHGNRYTIRVESIDGPALEFMSDVSLSSAAMIWNIEAVNVGTDNEYGLTWHTLDAEEQTALYGSDLDAHMIRWGIPTYTVTFDAATLKAAREWADLEAKRQTALNAYSQAVRRANTSLRNTEDANAANVQNTEDTNAANVANAAATNATNVANTARTNAANVANTNDTNATNVANAAATNATNVANTARTNTANVANTNDTNATAVANNAATGTTDVANTRRTNAANVANTNDTNATNVANTARTNATNVANTARTNAAATSNTTNDNALRDWAATQNKNLNYALTINGNAANTASNNQAVAKASRDAEEDKTYAYTMKSLSFLSNAVTGTLNTATGLAESVAGLNAFGAVGAVTGGISSVLSLMNSQAAYDASELLINNKRTNLSSYIGPSGSGVTDGIIQIANNKNNDNNAARDTHIDQMTAGEKTRATANTANTVNASNANATASEATSNTNAAASQTTSDANAARSETASNTNAADKATTSYNNAVRSQTTSDANAARSETASNANAAASAATSNANATRSQATSDANAARSETASNTNAAASAATSNANAARSQATSDANAARTRTVSDANAGYARADAVTAAKENLEQAQREAYAALKRASLELTTAGENAGDAELDVLNRRAFKIAVMTQSRYAMESTAATFKRYGYAYGAPIVPRDWLENGMYCYWRGHDAIIKGEAPDLFKRAFEGILTAGVTVWADPGKVGEYE